MRTRTLVKLSSSWTITKRAKAKANEIQCRTKQSTKWYGKQDYGKKNVNNGHKGNKNVRNASIPKPWKDNRVLSKSQLTSWRIRLKCTSCFLKLTTSCSIEFLSDLSTTRSSDDELSSCECRLICWRCLRCSLRDVFDGVLRLCRLSSDRGLSEPFWLSGELLLVCMRRLSRRVARAGRWDLQKHSRSANSTAARGIR